RPLNKTKGCLIANFATVPSLSPPTICNSAFFHNYIQTARKAVTGDLICNLLVKLMYQKRWFL
ncbi:hypothetical protein RNP13_26645, partial [Escherichia coli]|nr:hypothetical protein [Escherichia coli]